ncbi:MAG: hypothetical protein LBT57_00825 [Puniceicoccales bacterium]|jgi:hypothetical protein|nr:hypothetical protein [Puniceicoccales bacterium]
MDNHRYGCSLLKSAFLKGCLFLAVLLPAKAQAYFTFFEKLEDIPEKILSAIQGLGLGLSEWVYFKQYLCLSPDEQISYVLPPISTEPKFLQAIKIFSERVQFRDRSNDQLPIEGLAHERGQQLAALKRKGTLEGFALKHFGSQQRANSLELTADWRELKSFWSAIYATVTGGSNSVAYVGVLVQTEIILCEPDQYLTCFMEHLNPNWKIRDVPGDGHCGFWSAITSMINIGDTRFAKEEEGEYFADDPAQMRALREKIYGLMRKDCSEGPQKLQQHITKAGFFQEEEGGSFQEESGPSPFWLWQDDFAYLARATEHPVMVIALTEDGHSVTFNVSLAEPQQLDIRDIGSLRACIRANPGFIKMFHSGNHYQAIIRFR